MSNVKQQGIVLLVVMSLIILLMEGCFALAQICELDLHSSKVALENHHDWMVLQHDSFAQARLLMQGKSITKTATVALRVKSLCRSQCWKKNIPCQLVDVVANYHHKLLEFGLLEPVTTPHPNLSDCPVTHFYDQRETLLWLHRRYESF